MRAFTPDVESALRWFRWTYALTVIPLVGARYERASWPADGGAGAQDAWLTQALEVLCGTHNVLLQEAARRGRGSRKKRRQTRE